MFFLVDNNNKVIFGWSAKCGCSHIKRIFYFLINNKIDNTIHTDNDRNKLPDDIMNYTTIIISRNPYERLISGFLHSYFINGDFRHLWKYKFITFSKFIDELVKNDWKMIENHHFTPQTTENFDEKILMSKCVKCYDIKNIDYNYIEELYNIKIPETLLHKKEGHERKKYELSYNNYVYDLRMMVYYNFNVDIKYFYNEKLKNKVFNFYKNDFDFFNKLGIDYINTNFL
jgi:hypothetical protein